MSNDRTWRCKFVLKSVVLNLLHIQSLDHTRPSPFADSHVCFRDHRSLFCVDAFERYPNQNGRMALSNDDQNACTFLSY